MLRAFCEFFHPQISHKCIKTRSVPTNNLLRSFSTQLYFSGVKKYLWKWEDRKKIKLKINWNLHECCVRRSNLRLTLVKMRRSPPLKLCTPLFLVERLQPPYMAEDCVAERYNLLLAWQPRDQVTHQKNEKRRSVQFPASLYNIHHYDWMNHDYGCVSENTKQPY